MHKSQTRLAYTKKQKTQAEELPKNFLEFYNASIAPKLKTIDVMLKTYRTPFSKEKVSSVLNLSIEEIESIMKTQNLKKIDRYGFMMMMQCGSSQICKLYQREVSCGSPYTYTEQEIAYIYNLGFEEVKSACCQLGIREATSATLPLLFSIL